MISTRHLDRLPPPEALIRTSKHVALLDEILWPEWEDRYYSFDPRWGKGEVLASMRNGSGDLYFLWSSKHGTVLRGFDHESPMSPFQRPDESPWPGLLEGFPEELSYALREPAFALEEITFCIWRRKRERRWSIGDVRFPRKKDPDGSAALLGILAGDPEDYVAHARAAGVTVKLGAVRRVYEGDRIDASLVRFLNPDADVRAVLRSAKAMGLPVDPRIPEPLPRGPRVAAPRQFDKEIKIGADVHPPRVALVAGNAIILQKKGGDAAALYDAIVALVRARLSR